ncbi:MAG TPA: hypothetical protein VFI91_01710, partial [Longimicrobiaceae bacterium]|nr:hypothetical protein [Longimicrobiaceae bacterium]
MRIRTIAVSKALNLVVILAIAGCTSAAESGSSEDGYEPAARMAPDEAVALVAPAGKKYFKCKTGPATRQTMMIGPAGDTLKLNGHWLYVPAGALSETIEFEIR